MIWFLLFMYLLIGSSLLIAVLARAATLPKGVRLVHIIAVLIFAWPVVMTIAAIDRIRNNRILE